MVSAFPLVFPLICHHNLLVLSRECRNCHRDSLNGNHRKRFIGIIPILTPSLSNRWQVNQCFSILAVFCFRVCSGDLLSIMEVIVGKNKPRVANSTSNKKKPRSSTQKEER